MMAICEVCGFGTADSEYSVSVPTCPECLPVGSIEWLIENGRQLELLEEEGVVTDVRGLESIEKCAQDQVKNLKSCFRSSLDHF